MRRGNGSPHQGEDDGPDVRFDAPVPPAPMPVALHGDVDERGRALQRARVRDLAREPHHLHAPMTARGALAAAVGVDVGREGRQVAREGRRVLQLACRCDVRCGRHCRDQ